MNLLSLIESLEAAGVTPQQILAAIKHAEREKLNKTRELTKERVRKHRNASNALQPLHSVTSVTKVSPLVPPSDGFPDPSFTPPYNPPIQNIHSARENFSDWWEVYPHKIGKGAAEKSYLKSITKASHHELVEGVKRYISTKPPDRDYCNPATWLNQERWKDQPAEIINATANRNEKQSAHNTFGKAFAQAAGVDFSK
jgi:hypothetical protein